MSIGDTFYGVFAGLGDVNAGGINTNGLIDPFFFSGTDAVPEPRSLWLVLTGLGGVMWLRTGKHRHGDAIRNCSLSLEYCDRNAELI